MPTEYENGSDFTYTYYGALLHYQIGGQDLVIAAPQESLFTHRGWFNHFALPMEQTKIVQVNKEAIILYSNFPLKLDIPPKRSGSNGSVAEYFFEYPLQDRQGRVLGQYMPPAYLHNGEANASRHGHEGSEDYNWVKGELAVETSEGVQILNEQNPHIYVLPFKWHQAKNLTNEPSIAIIRCNFEKHIRDLSRLH